MSNQEENNITIEKTKTRVILKVNTVEIQMRPALARELGDQLYKCGCDVGRTESM
jgi:hypothetical protein